MHYNIQQKPKNKMTIKVRLDVSQSTNSASFTLGDLGLTEQQWEAYTDDERQEIIQAAVDDLPDQPYWIAEIL